ncbi:MAG: ribosomal L7Ae/L30e/S12e/Gadd45 family protein, partial [Candidatus Bathyarchaeota archaeon]
AKMVYIAEDVEPPEVVAHLPILCEERKAQYIFVPSKIRLGMSIGLNVSSAAACIIDPGDSGELIAEMINRLNELKKKG